MSRFQLKAIIVAKGFTVRSFAEYTGIDYNKMRRIVATKQEPSLTDIKIISKALKESPLIFFTDDVLISNIGNE